MVRHVNSMGPPPPDPNWWWAISAASLAALIRALNELNNRPTLAWLSGLVIRVITAMFAGWLTYEMFFVFGAGVRASVVASSAAGWAGAEGLWYLQGLFRTVIERRLGVYDDEVDRRNS